MTKDDGKGIEGVEAEIMKIFGGIFRWRGGTYIYKSLWPNHSSKVGFLSEK